MGRGCLEYLRKFLVREGVWDDLVRFTFSFYWTGEIRTVSCFFVRYPKCGNPDCGTTGVTANCQS